MKFPPPPIPNFVKYTILIMLGAFIVVLCEIVGNSITEHNSLAQEPCVEALPIQPVQAPYIEATHIQSPSQANTVIDVFIVTNGTHIRLNLHLKGQP
jgi:hypothetical protein